MYIYIYIYIHIHTHIYVFTDTHMCIYRDMQNCQVRTTLRLEHRVAVLNISIHIYTHLYTSIPIIYINTTYVMY